MDDRRLFRSSAWSDIAPASMLSVCSVECLCSHGSEHRLKLSLNAAAAAIDVKEDVVLELLVKKFPVGPITSSSKELYN